MTNSEADAKKIAAKLEKVPEVLRVMSLDSFVPEDQPAKLKLIAQAAKVLDPALNPDQVDAAPSDAENVEALKGTAESLRKTAGDGKGPGAVAAKRLADGLSKLADSNQATRDKAQNIFVSPLKIVFEELKNTLQAGPVTLQHAAARPGRRLEDQGRLDARRGVAEGRSQRQRQSPQIC